MCCHQSLASVTGDKKESYRVETFLVQIKLIHA
ncbi:unnamed protein product, partial [Larinioides sclopetarius]